MSKRKASHVDRAIPTLRQPKRNDVEKVQLTRTMSVSMAASPEWAQATDVQHVVTTLGKQADDLEANAKAIANLRQQVVNLETKQVSSRRDWSSTIKLLLGTVEVFCGGSVDRVKAFSLDVRHPLSTGALAAPAGLSLIKGKHAGEVIAQWTRGNAHAGFVVQHATDTANPATYSAQSPCTKVKYTLGGLPSGSIVHFRVAAVDPRAPGDLSPWSEWTTETVP